MLLPQATDEPFPSHWLVATIQLDTMANYLDNVGTDLLTSSRYPRSSAISARVKGWREWATHRQKLVTKYWTGSTHIENVNGPLWTESIDSRLPETRGPIQQFPVTLPDRRGGYSISQTLLPDKIDQLLGGYGLYWLCFWQNHRTFRKIRVWQNRKWENIL